MLRRGASVAAAAEQQGRELGWAGAMVAGLQRLRSHGSCAHGKMARCAASITPQAEQAQQAQHAQTMPTHQTMACTGGRQWARPLPPPPPSVPPPAGEEGCLGRTSPTSMCSSGAAVSGTRLSP